MELVNLWDSKKVIEFLGITKNNLYQLNYRKQLNIVKRVGKVAYYDPEQVALVKVLRDAKNAKV